MNTKWDTAIFLFVGLVAAVLLICAVIDRRDGRKPITALVAAICSACAFFVIVAGLNDPSKIIRVLGAPSKGLSSAVIMQAVTLFAGIFTFAYIGKNRPVASIVAITAAFISVCSLGRMYMTTTRPALNSWLIAALLLVLVIQAAVIFSGRKFATDSRYQLFSASATVLCGLLMSIFIFRLSGLNPQDRALDIHLLTQAPLLIILCGVFLLCAFLPLMYSLMLRKFVAFQGAAPIIGMMHLCGIFLFSVLINQMPLVERGINNRIFF